MFNRVVIVGVGLIGGSFALGLKAASAAGTIVGLERSAQALARARELGIIDVACADPAQALQGADLVLQAAPVAQTGAILASLLPFLESHTIVFDDGITTSDVVARAREVMTARRSKCVRVEQYAGRDWTGT